MFKFLSTSFLLLCYLFVFQTTAQVTADFSADTTSGCGSASVNFTDLSSGNITSWSWSFGNSNTSNVQNPTAIYTIVGSYDVTLIVNGGGGSDTITKPNFISVFRNPTADFSVNPSTGCSPLSVSFTDNSTSGSAPIDEYIWDFSDGSQPSSAQNPTHTYQNGGSFPPSLQVIDQNGCIDVKAFNNVVVTAAPVADFNSSNSRTCGDTLTVNFNNTSTGANLNYKWFFGDGDSSTQANPTHFYNTLGVYDVTLITSDQNCADTLIIKNYVRLETTTADFSIPKKFYCFGETITLNNQSSGANLYRWDFGDGSTSSQENPTKIYRDSGVFVIKLTVSAGAICLKSVVDTIYVQQVIADFAVTPKFTCLRKDTAIFINKSFNADSIVWRVQDTDTSSEVFLGLNLTDTIFLPQTAPASGLFSFGDTLEVYSNEGCSDILINPSSRQIKPLETNILYDENLNKAIIDTPITLTKLEFKSIIGGCAPLSVNFSSSSSDPGKIVSWEWDLGIVNSNLSAPAQVTYTDDSLRKITLKITNDLGCNAFDTVDVAAGFKPTPNFILNPDSICPGGGNFIYEASTDSLKINSWAFEFYSEFTNEKFSSQFDTIQDTTAKFGIKRGKRFIDLPDTGSYKIVHTVGQNGCDTVDSTNSILFIQGPFAEPKAEIVGNCLDRRNVQFTGNFKNVTRFVWDFGDTTILDSTNENPTHSYADFKTYKPSLIIYNDNNSCDSIIDTLEINLVAPPPLQITPPNRVLCNSSSSITLSSNTTLQYDEFNWIINGDTVGRKAQYILDTIPGVYIIELSTKEVLGCTESVLDTFYVSSIEVGFDTTVLRNCLPVNLAFKDTSISDTTITSWNWRFGNGVTSTQRADTILYNTTGVKTVNLEVGNALGCISSIEKKDFLNFDFLDVRFLNDLNTICLGDSITFRNISSGLNPIYTWDFGDGTTLIDTSAEYIGHNYTQGGTYTVTLTALDESGCVISERKPDLITVNEVIAGFTADTLVSDCYPFAVNFEDTTSANISKWEWRFGDGASSVFESPFHNFTSVGNFDIFLKVSTPIGCSDSIEKVGYIQTKGPEAEFVFDKDTICINEEVNFNITQSNNVASFFWDFGDGNGGQGNPVSHTYTQKTGKIVVSLIVSDNSGNCTVPLEDSLYVYEVKADFDISDDTVCVPYEAQFTKQSIGDDSFKWVFAPGVFSTETNPTYTYSQAGKFAVSLEINSNIGCTDIETKNIEVFPIPQAIVSQDTGFCEGDSVLLKSSGGLNYEWKPTEGLFTPFNANTYAKPDSTTNYQLLVSNIAGCIDSNSVEVFVQHPLNYDSIPDSSIIIGETINLNATAGLGFKYKWTPENGLSCDDCAMPVAKPLKNQTYILEIFDDFGCYYLKDTIEIEVIEKYSLDVPTAFSPNGDGSNDIIYAKGWGLKELIAFKIYNRFGELVFESTDFEKGWDGNYRGQPQNIETYIFTVEALTYSGKVLSKKGNISLLK